jgi:DNA-binding CsgD family transcriptional regulator
MIREPTGPSFIARRAELDMLTSALSDAVEERPRAVFVAGEAGVGKSRLVSHFLGLPASRGTWRMTGACVDVSGESLPYGPIRDALRSFVANVPDRERTRVLDSVPATLQALLSEASSDRRRPPSEGSAPQVLTFEALFDLIAEAAAVRPLLIVLEDLHWADSSSLACLNFLLSQLRSERALIVGTYRSDELHRTHRLRPWIAEQLRKEIVELIDLPRFNRGETESLVEAVLGTRPHPDIGGGIYERSEGNAFFVEELSRTAPGRNAALPMTLREILLARIRNLSDEVQALLRVAAVGGRSIDPDVLSEITGTDHDMLFTLLRQAVARNVVATDTDRGEFGFRHALLHEVALSEVLPGERERVHVAYAEALLHRADDAPDASRVLAQIAHHLWSAREVDKALTFAIRAGDAALDVGAFTTAKEHFERALSLWSAAADPRRTGIDRAELLERTASAAHLAGDDERAVAFVTTALDEIDAVVEPIRAGLLYEKLGWYHFTGGPRSDAFAAYERALELVPPDPPSPARARVLAAYSRLQMLWARNDEAIRLGEEAIRVATATGARREECMALNALGVAVAARGEPERGLDCLRQSLALAKELGDHDEEARVYINLGESLSQLGRKDEAVQVWLEGYERAYQAGLRMRSGGFLLCNVAEVLYHKGDWGAMETMLGEAEKWVAPGLNEGFWLTLTGRLKLGLGDFAAARDCLERAAVHHRDSIPWIASDAQRDLAELALWEERLDESHDLIVNALELIDDNDEQHMSGLVLMVGLWAEAERAAAPGVSDAARDAALQRANRLVSAAQRKGWHPMSPPADTRVGVAAVGRAAAANCRAELTRLEGSSNAELWAEAASQWSACDRPYDEAYARWREAEARALAGNRRAAETALRRAMKLATDLGARPLIHEIEMLARSARLELAPERKEKRADAEPAPDVALGLTQRELEVFRHLALGRTNREIADVLFISPKTASVHVSNIMRKLGVSNRTAAATIAHKAGLTEQQPTLDPDD